MRRGVAVLVVVGALVAVARASGDGAPAQTVLQGWDGAARGGLRYVAVPTPGWTTLEVIARRGGRVLRYMSLKGDFGVPIVAVGGGSDALLRDDRTLVLGQPFAGAQPRTRSTFALVDTFDMRELARIHLHGDFSFDAASPDGSLLYLTQYLSPLDRTRYRLRVFDLRSGRLLRKVVIDRTEPREQMTGQPLSRVDRGGWAFTLYAGIGARPFVHALNTRHASAVCIDLPWKHDPPAIYSYRLGWSRSGRLVVRGAHGQVLFAVARDFRS